MNKEACSRCRNKAAKSGYKTCQKCFEYNREYKKLKSSTPLIIHRRKVRTGIYCGRRNCKQCGCWRHLHEFYVVTWKDEQKSQALHFRGICRTCERINGRAKNAKKNGRTEPYKPKDWNKKKLTHKQALARRRQWTNKKAREDQEFAAKIRENQSFYADKKRREMGLGTKEVEKSIYQRGKGSELLYIEPFQQWIETKLEVIPIEEFALIVDTSARTIHRWRTGREIDKMGKERIIDKIPLHTVDIAITREGNTALWELYPELYE